MRTSHLGGCIERLEERRLLSLSLLTDINLLTNSSSASPPVTLGSYGYFVANDGIHGSELWKTDGTAAGTSMVTGINPGLAISIVGGLQVADGLLYFSAVDASGSINVWRSDGTVTGTFKLTSVSTGAQFLISNVISDNGVAIFGSVSFGLWRSDGTVANTSQIAPIDCGNIAQIGNEIYVYGTSSTTSTSGLWMSDGTSAGTELVRQFSFPSETSVFSANDKLYFWATDSTLNTGNEPWSSDGTTAGTAPLGDLAAGTASSTPVNLVAFNGGVYFTASIPSTSDLLLFRTDGTANSATMVADVGAVGTAIDPSGLIVYNGMLYFRGFQSGSGVELWRSDGTAGGTGQFDDLNPGGASSSPTGFQIYNNRLYFIAQTAAEGFEMRSTDGTVAGTTLLKDIAPGTKGIITGIPATMPTIFTGRLYFQANDATHGIELWSTDGTSAGTTMLADINTTTGDSNPSAFTLGPGGFYYFTANDSIDGTQLWKTDGTAAGTSMLTTGLTAIASLTFINNLLLFEASDSVAGLELWRSDGTVAGTTRVADISAGSTSGLVSGEPFVQFGNRIFFGASTDITSVKTYGLWASDGTAAGTQLIVAPSSVFSVSEFSGIEYNGKLIFFSPTGSEDAGSIFITDGTAAGTSLVQSGFSEGTNGLAANWTVFNGKAFFTEQSSVGNELWSSDGTTSGTVAYDLDPGSGNSSPAGLVVTPDFLYFAATDSTGRELWRIDKTTMTPTRLTSGLNVQQVRASAAGGVILTSGGNVYRYNGNSLIVLSTTSTVTAGSLLGSANGLDYFSATSNATGAELWMTDGTTAGTVMVQDLVPGSGSSSPQNLSVIGNTVYVSATTPATGREIYVLPPYARLNSDGSLTLEGTQSSDVLTLISTGGIVSASLFGATLTFPQSAITNGVHILGNGGTDTLNVNGGSFDFDDDLGTTAPNLNIIVASGATVTFHSAEHVNSMSISGSAILVPGGANVLVTKTLTLQPGGSLDLTNNAAVVDYTGSSPIAMIQSEITDGYAGGSWTGPGIRSSSAATNPGTTLAFGESSKILGPTGGSFAGQTVDGTAVLIRYTLNGDANLDGQINTLDFNVLAANFNGSGKNFSQGDFNFDGVVNASDFALLASRYGASLPPAQPAAAFASVPLASATPNLFATIPIGGNQSDFFDI